MYNYEKEKPRLFTEAGQVLFLVIRDESDRLLNLAGAFRLQEILNLTTVAGETWEIMACIDRRLELKELREITTEGVAQYRVFVKK